MAGLSPRSTASPGELDRMVDVYRRGGQKKRMAPDIAYPEAVRPHDGCDMPMQAIDLRLEDYSRAVHDPLVRTSWDDRDFVGRCPRCGGWIHFTNRVKRSIGADEAPRYSRVPDSWYAAAAIL